MTINRSGYSIGDTIRRGKRKYVVIAIKQRPKKLTVRTIVNGTHTGSKKIIKYK